MLLQHQFPFPVMRYTANSAEKLYLPYMGESSLNFALRNAAELGGKHIQTMENAKPITVLFALAAVKNFKPTEIPNENTALTTVIYAAVLKVVMSMSNEQFEAEKSYQVSMFCFRQMLENGKITKEEYKQIDTILLKKYRPLLGKLLSDIPLT
ncbi:MAG: hypothetical protein LUC97_04240 [Clostridiales bacterium]|nr:hypothetical protein [Clostridiales bacterium]